jgi:hypothetical protein
MSANGISTLATKEDRLKAKLDLASLKRRGYSTIVQNTTAYSVGTDFSFSDIKITVNDVDDVYLHFYNSVPTISNQLKVGMIVTIDWDGRAPNTVAYIASTLIDFPGHAWRAQGLGFLLTIITTTELPGNSEDYNIDALHVPNGTFAGSGSPDTNAPFYRTNNEYDITLLPAQYVGDTATNNLNEGGLQTGRPWVTFLPSDLFAASEKGVWYDPGDITTLFQDTAGTIPVTASGQTVALMKDKSGNNAHATQSDATKRPTFTIYPGTDYGYLSFDGTNDFMVTSAINFTGTAVMTATAGFQVVPPTGVTGPRIVVELSASSVTNEGSFYMTGPATSSDHSVGLRGNSASQAYASFANVDPSDDILTAQLNIGAATKELELIPRLNGVVKSGAGLTWGGSANAGTGNFGNYALYIGARGGTSLFFKGNLYGMVIRGATSTAPQVTATEAWVTARLY